MTEHANLTESQRVEPCPSCEGRGQVWNDTGQGARGMGVMPFMCLVCDGTGILRPVEDRPKRRLKPHIARKRHRCDTCGRAIEPGTRYWRNYDEAAEIDFREHTNCEDFKTAAELPFGFNQNRSAT